MYSFTFDVWTHLKQYVATVKYGVGSILVRVAITWESNKQILTFRLI